MTFVVRFRNSDNQIEYNVNRHDATRHLRDARRYAKTEADRALDNGEAYCNTAWTREIVSYERALIDERQRDSARG